MKKNYDAAFTVKVAVEAIKEPITLQELAEKYEIHPGQGSQWKSCCWTECCCVT